MYGFNMIGRNYADKNKNATKISVIIDKNCIPVAIQMAKGNIHDTNLVLDTLDNSVIKIIYSKLIADKGYVNNNQKQFLHDKKNIDLIYSYRNNQHNVNTEEEKLLLKERSKIERFFS